MAVGKERILTCVSGDFGWHGGKNPAEIFVCGKFGKSTGDYSAEFFADNGEVRVRLMLKEGQCAVILPVGIEADFQGDVRLLEPRYENGGISAVQTAGLCRPAAGDRQPEHSDPCGKKRFPQSDLFYAMLSISP